MNKANVPLFGVAYLFIPLTVLFFWQCAGLIMSIYELDFAPPWTWVKNSIPLLSCVNISIGLMFLTLQKLPSCQPLSAQSLQIRYQCKTLSVDNPGISYIFSLEGWENFPVMRVTEPPKLIQSDT